MCSVKLQDTLLTKLIMFPLFDHLLFNNLASYSLKFFNHSLDPILCNYYDITYSCRIMFLSFVNSSCVYLRVELYNWEIL